MIRRQLLNLRQCVGVDLGAVGDKPMVEFGGLHGIIHDKGMESFQMDQLQSQPNLFILDFFIDTAFRNAWGRKYSKIAACFPFILKAAYYTPHPFGTYIAAKVLVWGIR